MASLLLVSASARAEWRTPIAGAPAILPATRFEPNKPPAARAEPADEEPGVSFAGAPPPPPTPVSLPARQVDPQPARLAIAPAPPRAAAALEAAPDGDAPIQWVAPLFDRRLTSDERSADIAPDLLQAIVRIEPMYDPTRLYGPAMPVRMAVSAGSAAMDNVFADHWQRADLDANVNQRVAYIAMAWHRRGQLPCEAFSKNRARGYNAPALTTLSRIDCAVLARSQAQSARVVLAPVVAGLIDVPTFAAPMPGARMSSVAFWSLRRAEIARAEEDLALRRVWHGGKEGVARSLVAKDSPLPESKTASAAPR